MLKYFPLLIGLLLISYEFIIYFEYKPFVRGLECSPVIECVPSTHSIPYYWKENIRYILQVFSWLSK